MPPPPSFIDVTPTPFSRVVTVAEFNGGTFGGIANEVWFRHMSTPAGVLGVRPNVERVVNMKCQVYQSDGTTLIRQSTNSRPLDIEETAATTYYIRIVKNAGGAIAADFTAEFDIRPLVTAITDGDFFINDFNAGVPGIVYNPDGTVVGYIHLLPAAEFGAMLADGTVLLNTPTSGLQLFDANLSFVLTVSGLHSSATVARGDGQWWIIESDGTVETVSADGMTVTIVATLPDQPASFGVSLNQTILYYVDFDSPIVKRWNLLTDMAMADLYTAPDFDNAGDGDVMGLTVNFTSNGELLILDDGTLVTWWLDLVNSETNFLHLTAGGVLLNRITITGYLVDHPQNAIEGANYIFVWMQDPGQVVALFGLLNLTTEVLSPVFTTAEFAGMINGNPSDPSYNQDMFGPETSCIMLRRSTFAGGGGGGGGGSPSEGIIGPLVWVHWPRVQP